MEHKINYYGDSSPVIVVENFYTESELSRIWRELEFLTYKEKMLTPEQTGAGVDLQGNVKKINVGLFLDYTYANRAVSDILTVNRKVFNMSFLESCTKKNPLFRGLSRSNCDTTLISYYENKGVYASHADSSSFTILTYFFKEPKEFTGGDLIFNDFDLKIEVKNNLLVLFHSPLMHEVTEVKMDKKDSDGFSGFGRYCMTQFLGHKF